MLQQLNDSLSLIILETQANFKTLSVIIAIPFCVFFLSCIYKPILYLGIIPRRAYGLIGILFAPFLHLNFNHLFFNSIPLLVLSDFLLINGLNYFLEVTIIIAVISGLLIWCFARNALYIGASSIITGYWALLITNILQVGGLTSLILGIICIYYFAGIFLGIFPGEKGVAWEGHLFGLLAGLSVNTILQPISIT